MQFCLFGSYGQNNFGDEAIADGIEKQIHQLFPQAKLILFSHNLDQSLHEHPQFSETRPMIASGVRSFLLQKNNHDWKKNRTIIKNSDWVIIGGGGIFHDKEINQTGPNPLFIWWLRSLFFKKLQKKIIIWSVGIGPIEKSISRFFLKGILKRADIITVRDQVSLDIAQKFTTKEIHLIPDPVWGLFKASSEHKKDILGINIRENHRLPAKQLLPKLISTISQILTDYKLKEIHLIPFATKNPDDRDLMTKVLPELQKHFPLPVSIVTPTSTKEAFSLVHECSQFIAMRFHSYIFAISADIPCKLISYSSKTDEITKHNKSFYLHEQEKALMLWKKNLS